MNGQARREMWRSRCERLVSSGMGVHEWCDLNHVHASSMYGWLKRFLREDPSVFGGVELPGDGSCHGQGWYESVRMAYAATHAIVPLAEPEASFAVVDTAGLSAGPRAAAEITVELGAATVRCPAGCDADTLAAVLRAVGSL